MLRLLGNDTYAVCSTARLCKTFESCQAVVPFVFLQSVILSWLLLPAHLLHSRAHQLSLWGVQCPQLHSLAWHPALSHAPALCTRWSANTWLSTVPAALFKLSQKFLGSWPANGLASFELIQFTVGKGGRVTWPEAVGWNGVSDRWCAKGRYTGRLLKKGKTHSFVICLSGPL